MTENKAIPALTDRNILVTGGTGTFGQAFARRALDLGVRRLAIFSRGEAKQAAMRVAFGDDPRLRFLVGDVRDATRCLEVCRGVDTVIHAAALKRVEVCEQDPAEAVATNILGTLHLARAAVERGVRHAVFLSTDKACSPNTLYGSTKLTAERLWRGANAYGAGTGTRFACTRYGNVLGSTGSVVPLWQQQAAQGMPLTLTDAGMTRFWMRIEDAVELVLLALARMRGGEVFVPKIGRAWVTDLAEAVAPGAPRTVTGLRPGEKLHETLITEDEARTTYDDGECYVMEPEAVTWETRPPSSRPWVGPGFTYRSDRGSMLTPEDLRRML